MLDLDHFKDFNDTYGHPAGDEALRTFARVLGASIRSSDVAARYGGEEFVVALHHAGLDDAQRVAEKIRASVEQMVVEIGPGRYGRITASLGVASTETQVHELRALVAMADAALYRAKESGRNRVEVAPMADDVTILAAGQPTATGAHRARTGGVRRRLIVSGGSGGSPVRSIVAPAPSTAAIASASRIEPPGWTKAVTPASRQTSTASGNG